MSDLPVARITGDAVYVGGVKLPGVIAADGVSVVPGGLDQINRLIVTFLCGEVVLEDPVAVPAGESRISNLES